MGRLAYAGSGAGSGPLCIEDTDPKMAANVVNWQLREARTGRLEGTPSSGALGGAPFGPTAGGVDILANAVIGAIVKQPPAGQDLMKLATEYKTATFIRSQTKGYTPLAYKARPLNGIWATAPYLHDGSVPSLWQVLQPSEARSQKSTRPQRHSQSQGTRSSSRALAEGRQHHHLSESLVSRQ